MKATLLPGNRTIYPSCDHVEMTWLDITLYASVFPMLLVVCVVGNTFNIIVYTQPFLRYSTTIHLLASKAAANMIYMLLMLPNLLIVFMNKQSALTRFLIQHRPIYILFFANACGTFAIWITVLLAVERFILIRYPFEARRWATMRNAHICIFLFAVASLILHLEYPMNRKVLLKNCRIDNASLGVYAYVRYRNPVYGEAYYWLSATSVLFVPILSLIVLSALINYELFAKRRDISSNTEQKHCVTRLSMATTMCLLVFESPQIPVFVAGAVVQPQTWMTESFRTILSITNFLSMCSTTAPFPVYFACSDRFRQLCISTVTRLFLPQDSRRLSAVPAGRRRTRGYSTIDTTSCTPATTIL